MAAEKPSQPHDHLKMPQSRVQSQYPLLFASMTFLLVLLFQWPLRWLLSGAPIWQFIVLLGGVQGHRILPDFHLWPLFTTLNLVYAVCSTSWLLYYAFAAACYPAIGLTCLFQFRWASNIARRSLRKVLKELHFIDDKIAFFEIPALEIDTEVSGLLVVRGVTFSLSTLSFVAHGIEVGVKLSDDMELAIQTDQLEVKLFREIRVGDCFANIKGGKYEMTFGELEGNGGTTDIHGDQVLVEGTPLLKAASRGSETTLPLEMKLPKELKMTEKMTDGKTPEDATPEEALKDIKTMSPENEEACGRYQQMMDSISSTSEVQQAINHITSKTQLPDENALRAAICSNLHSQPSVPHPPSRSVRVSTIKQSTPPHIKRFQHRFPMLLRLLLNPLSYFHPVHFSSITATASGEWISSLLHSKIFKSYSDTNTELSALRFKIEHWLSDANFCVELSSILGIAHVPFLAGYDINCNLNIDDVMAYRSLPKHIELSQVIRLGGADASFIVPSFLLPHHEHLLPPPPTRKDKKEQEREIEDADGIPKTIQAEKDLEQLEKDETNVKISVHARLPACFDQELLDFTAALVKATKVVEIEKEESPMDVEVAGIKDFGRALRGTMKGGVKKVVVDGVVNANWIAKLVGKITKKLEGAQGDIGYSGDIPVNLGVYRHEGWREEEGEKILP